jgi:RNA polymerase sigma-70 factor, ECF subfamily
VGRWGQNPRRESRVIDLVYFHGKSVKEIAEIVGIGEATVKTRMFYARKKLADFLAAA